jgi:hypothetical protein
MVFAFAISQQCADNPALPQSVPSSVLLNFFMTASESMAGERPAFFEAQAKGLPSVPGRCNVITLHLALATCLRPPAT